MNATAKRPLSFLAVAVLIICAALAWITYLDLFSDPKSRIRASPLIFVATRHQLGVSPGWSVTSVLKGSGEPKFLVKPGDLLPESFFPGNNPRTPPDTLLVFMGRRYIFGGALEPEALYPIEAGRVRSLDMTLSEISALCSLQP
jgi:hypothetical protein